MLVTRRRAATWFASTVGVILLLAFYQKQVQTPARRQGQAPASVRDQVQPPLTVRRQPAQAPASVRAEHHWRRCRRALQLTQVHFLWERQEDGQQEDGRQEDGQREDGRQEDGRQDKQRCLQRPRSQQELHLGLRRLAELRGRPARLVLVGDSRIRILQQAMLEELELEPDEPWPNMTLHYDPDLFSEQRLQRAAPSLESLNYEELPPGCLEAHVLTPVPVVQCSLVAFNSHLRAEFWWRPYPDGRLADRLDWLLEECAAGRCPDITVLDGGAWSGTIYRRIEGLRTPMRVVSFAEDLAKLQLRLRRLASVTRLLWKVDEPFTPEASLRHRSNKTAAMMVTTAAVYQMAQKVPGLNLWTTGIAEWLQYYHRVCMTNTDTLWDEVYEGLDLQCLDPMHMGSVVQRRMILTLFDVLLQDVAKSNEDFCCS